MMITISQTHQSSSWVNRIILIICGIFGIAGSAITECQGQVSLPNIVLINADDLGYGDVGAYGSQHISTPHIDSIARHGLRFTNGYATSATCTPSRYSLLTGEYPWRQKGTGVLPGDASLIISPGRQTLPAVLQQAGYKTGVVGKWHLGLGKDQIDWNREIASGPLEVGFSQSFIMAATGDRVPCVYVRDHHVVGLSKDDPLEVNYNTPYPGEPTGKLNPELLTMHPSHGHDMGIVNGISRIGYYKGGRSALWKDEEMADTFTAEAVQFIEQNRSQPFFLYFALHDPHVPRVPHPRFVGKTELGPRGDVIVQADWCVGEILKTLDRLQLSDNTLVIFTSDNGPVVDDGYQDDAVKKLGKHSPAGNLRGGKYSKFEAGTRVPFIVRWKGKIQPGVSDAIISQVDLPATLASLVGSTISKDAAPDSLNLLPALLGESQLGRDEVVLQAGRGLSLRVGKWKYIPPSSGVALKLNTNTETGNAPHPQLYDLQSDPGEQVNLAKKFPDQVRQMQRRLRAIQNQ